MQQNKLFVGNYPFSVDEAQLRDLFSTYGDIEDLSYITDRYTGQSKGFSFITFVTQHAAEQALELNGKNIDGRNLKVNIATDKPKRGRGGRSRW